MFPSVCLLRKSWIFSEHSDMVNRFFFQLESGSLQLFFMTKKTANNGYEIYSK